MPATGISIPQLAREISENTGISVDRAESVLRGLVDTMSHHLVERGERVYLHGLGTFSPKVWAGRRAVDISTGKIRETEDCQRVVFRPASIMRGLPVVARPGSGPCLMDECPV